MRSIFGLFMCASTKYQFSDGVWHLNGAPMQFTTVFYGLTSIIAILFRSAFVLFHPKSIFPSILLFSLAPTFASSSIFCLLFSILLAARFLKVCLFVHNKVFCADYYLLKEYLISFADTLNFAETHVTIRVNYVLTISTSIPFYLKC